ALAGVRPVWPTEDLGVLAEHLTVTAPQLGDETGCQIDADAAMVFTLARHGVDQAVKVLMALRGGALECQIFCHHKAGRRQDGMGTHDDLRSDRSATGSTRQDRDCHGTHARQCTLVPYLSGSGGCQTALGNARGNRFSPSSVPVQTFGPTTSSAGRMRAQKN